MDHSGLPHTPTSATTVDPSSATVSVHICPTTGGQIDMQIAHRESVETLKKSIGKKLKIPRERISLLFRDRLLKKGTMLENGLSDGCKITLLPNVESGLMSQKADNNVMQALENLTDVQVEEFLEGKSPLTLAMRMGEHMMMVQLQLSTTQLSNRRASSLYSKGPTSRHTLSQSVSMRGSPSSPRASNVARQPTVTNTLPTFSRIAVRQQSSSNNTAPDVVPSVPLATVSHSKGGENTNNLPVLNSVTLETASRNLHHRLREISKYSNPPKSSGGHSGTQASRSPSSLSSSASSPVPSPTRQSPSPSSPPASPTVTSSDSGATIETLHHHGQGVFSGTFSGTLNRTSQDGSSKPKRHIGTIIHILNDLLWASPQYRSHLGHRSHTEKRKRHHFHRQHRHYHHTSSPQHAKSINDQIRLSHENQLMRNKMEQLHSMMEERRQRRRERRQARTSPYSNWRHQHTPSPSDSCDNSMDVDANMETASVTDVSETIYNEFSQETVVV